MTGGFRLRDPVADQRMVDTPSLLAYLPQIVRYPLSGHALAALLLFTGMLWLGLQNITGIALLAIASPWVFHYAQAVIERTSIGQATPPAFGGDMIYLGSLSALRPLVGIGLLASLWHWRRTAHPGTELMVLLLGALLFPAHLLLLATDDRLLAAFNPLALLHAIAGVGASLRRTRPSLSNATCTTSAGRSRTTRRSIATASSSSRSPLSYTPGDRNRDTARASAQRSAHMPSG